MGRRASLARPRAEPPRARLGALIRCQSGNALIEFALMLPILTTATMYGLETAWMHTANMQVSQVALSVADGAARMEQADNSAVAPKVTEADITAVLSGGKMESNGLDFATRGRIILSSLEVNSSNQQYIHWQRCTGGYSAVSRYGTQNQVVTNMGAGASKITATSGNAVMFVEVFYKYKPLFGTMFVQPMVFHQEAAYTMRDARDLSALNGTAANPC